MEKEKLQREQMLGASWEHMPAIDPILIRSRMLFLQNEIRSLENRKRALLEEEQELIVRAVTLGDRDPLRRLEEINQRLALSFSCFVIEQDTCLSMMNYGFLSFQLSYVNLFLFFRVLGFFGACMWVC